MAGTIRGRAQAKAAADAAAQGDSNATSLTEYTEFKKAIAKSEALISGYQKLLKAAKFYKGPINGKYTPAFQSALDKAEESRLSISAIRPIGRDEFLQEQVTLGGSGDGSGPRNVTQVYEINDTDAEALINKIYQQATGYKPNAKQLANAKKDLLKQQRLNPVKQSYDSNGNLVQKGGFNEEQYLTEKVEQTAPAARSRATNANEILLGELGGLR
jgi:hypothetical protein